MINRILPILVLCFVTVSGYAGEYDFLNDCSLEDCRKIKDIVTERINLLEAREFKVAYRDLKNKLTWSFRLPGGYTNGCFQINGEPDTRKCSFVTLEDGTPVVKVDDSNAAKACKDIGGRLPTKLEYESLMRNFDHIILESDRPVVLTPKGQVQMKDVLHDNDIVHALVFWTSTLTSSILMRTSYVFYYYDPQSERDGLGYSNIATEGRDSSGSALVHCVADI